MPKRLLIMLDEINNIPPPSIMALKNKDMGRNKNPSLATAMEATPMAAVPTLIKMSTHPPCSSRKGL